MESLGAVWIVGLQWFFFTTVLVLYLIYFPPHLKYVNVTSHTVPWSHDMITTEHVPSTEWRFASVSAFTTLLHFLFITFTTFFLILTTPLENYPSQRIDLWAKFLGVLSTTLAIIQYSPQLWKTWNAKTVGALSIPMMCIQTPGAILMVTSIAIRPGTNWSSWATYAAAGIMQGSLLVMCICWKVRQRRLDIDDFGRPLHSHSTAAASSQHPPLPTPASNGAVPATGHSERTPLLSGASTATPAPSNPPKWYEVWRKK
jgi:hypothetical protein